MRKIIVLIAVMAGLCSCTDYLKVEPSNVLAVANYDDVKALLGGYLIKKMTFGLSCIC